MSERNPLVEVAEDVRLNAPGGKVAVIFDLDSTLFCVSPRTQSILRALASEPTFHSKYKEEAEILRDIEVLPTDWGVRQVLERRRKQNSLDVFLAIRDYWRKHFFSNGFLEHDVIYPAADEYVKRLKELGAEILYLTGRPEQHMREGTERALARFGFPVDSRAHLIMKPSDVETDESFKALVLQKIAPSYDRIWFFENEPVIIEHVRRIIPQVRVVFVNSVHAGRAESPPDLPTIGMSYRI